ncbi:hypothetical protein AVEN_149724-1 [Araneus ventricosus]|uniref:Uncharacterized protein n=1 Tax=Araneus ventricosus TaxID=182803 RepID=A0A4Y2VKH8_ARAVE|nr:hypothetical protein AVEN_149724-1 [Araneus ventricosus]
MFRCPAALTEAYASIFGPTGLRDGELSAARTSALRSLSFGPTGLRDGLQVSLQLEQKRDAQYLWSDGLENGGVSAGSDKRDAPVSLVRQAEWSGVSAARTEA